jgi:hypothetical protein
MTAPTSTPAGVAEGIRAAIATYTLALDDGRTDDVVATFCPDGAVDIPGLGAHQGREAIRAAFAAVEPTRPQRHLVFNTLITEWDHDRATAISDFVFALKKDGGGWSMQMVGRYHDSLHRDGETWRFHQRRAEFF